MVNYLMICRSLTYAQKTAKILEKSGISAVVIRTPRQVSEEGCGYCVKVSERRLADALVALKNADMSPKKIFMIQNNGHVKEMPT